MATSVIFGSKCELGAAEAVELMNAAFEENEDSCKDILSSTSTERSAGSCRSQVYDRMQKAVTTAEKRPA